MPEPLPVEESIFKIRRWKKKNNFPDNWSDLETARHHKDKFPKDNRFDNLIKAGFPLRAAGSLNLKASAIGQGIENFFKGLDGPVLDVVGRAGNFVAQSAPELAAGIGGAAILASAPASFPALALLGGAAALGGTRQFARTNDKASAAITAGTMAFIPGFVKGGQVLVQALVGKSLAQRATGAFVGGTFADATDLAFQPTGDANKSFTERPMANFREFASDPVNIPAYFLAQGPMAVIPVLADRFKASREQANTRRIATPDDTNLRDPENDSAAILADSGVKVPEGTSIAKQREVAAQLNSRAFTMNDAQLALLKAVTDPDDAQINTMADIENTIASEMKFIAAKSPDLTMMAEHPDTIKAQLRWLRQGKRKAVFIPAGSFKNVKVPKGSEVTPGGDGFFVHGPDLDPASIARAIEDDTVGELLGHGVPRRPLTDDGVAVVVRGPTGLEKQAVLVVTGDVPKAIKAALKMMDKDDSIVTLSVGNVATARRVNGGRIPGGKLFEHTGFEGANLPTPRRAMDKKFTSERAAFDFLGKLKAENRFPLDYEMGLHTKWIPKTKTLVFDSDVPGIDLPKAGFKVRELSGSESARLARMLEGKQRNLEDSYVDATGDPMAVVDRSKLDTAALDPNDPFSSQRVANRFLDGIKRAKLEPRLRARIPEKNRPDPDGTTDDAVGGASQGYMDLAIKELGERDPVAHQQLMDWISDGDTNLAPAILKDISQITGRDIQDVGLMRAMADMMGRNPDEGLSELLNILDLPAQRVITLWNSYLQTWMGDHSSPSLAGSVIGGLPGIPKLDGLVKEMNKVSQESYDIISNTGRYDLSDYIDNLGLGMFAQTTGNGFGHIPSELQRHARESAEAGVPGEHKSGSKMSFYATYLAGGLSRANKFEWTRPAFNLQHRFRGEVSRREMAFLTDLGQNDARSLTPEQALERTAAQFRALSESPARAAKVGKIAKLIQDRREENPNITREGLMSRDEMHRRGLSDRDAEFMDRLIDLPSDIATNRLVDMRASDSVGLARVLYSLVPDRSALTTDSMVEVATTLSAHADRLGGNLFAVAKATGDEKLRLRSLEQQLRETAEGAVSTATKGIIPDNMVPRIVDIMAEQGKMRAHHNFVTKVPGYFPEVRRGRFLLRIDRTTNMDSPDLETQGIDKKGEAQRRFKKAREDNPDAKVELFDKDELGDRYKGTSAATIDEFRQSANARFKQLAGEALASTENPDAIAAIEDLSKNYTSLTIDAALARSVKGGVFKLRRHRAPGFDTNDYLPNLIEYAQLESLSGIKRTTKARLDLELLRPEYQQNPEVKKRMIRDIEYSLRQPDNEAVGLRKITFHYYLGASLVHVMQNLSQTFVLGIQRLMLTNGSYTGSVRIWSKAARLAGRFAATGTTGDAQMDQLLNLAQREGVTEPNTLKDFLPGLGSHGIREMAAFSSGRNPLGAKIKNSSLAMVDGVENILRSTAVFGELVNRRWSYVMAVLQARGQGVTDSSKIHSSAKNFTEDVNFVGGRANRPGFITEQNSTWVHNSFLVLNTLRSFGFSHLAALANFWHNGKLGNLDITSEGRQHGVGNKKAFWAGVGHLGLLAGAMGLPGMGEIDEIFEMATGKRLSQAAKKGLLDLSRDFGIEAETGSLLADTLFTGLPSALGIDTSRSLGLGNLLGFRTGQDLLHSITGAPGGIVEKLGRAAEAIRRNPDDPLDWGSWEEAIRASSPTGLRYWIRLADAAYRNDYLDSRGRPVNSAPLSGKANTSLLMGFTPSEINHNQTVRFKAVRDKQRIQRKRADAVEIIAREISRFNNTGDPAARILAQGRWDNFVSKNPGESRDSLVNSIENAVASKKFFFNPAPTLSSQDLLHRSLAAYPTAKSPVRSRVAQRLGRLDVSLLLGEAASARSALSKRALRNAFLVDTLIEGGISPPVAALLVSRRDDRRLRLSGSGPGFGGTLPLR